MRFRVRPQHSSAERPRVGSPAADPSRERLKQLEVRKARAAGAIVLAKVDAGELDAKRFREWLDQALPRADDRALFDLPIGGG